MIEAGSPAKSEVHTVPEDRQHHAFSVVPNGENPGSDTVYDPHYLQFLPTDLRPGRQNVFIGRRDDIIALMAAYAKRPLVQKLYQPETLVAAVDDDRDLEEFVQKAITW